MCGSDSQVAYPYGAEIMKKQGLASRNARASCASPISFYESFYECSAEVVLTSHDLTHVKSGVSLL